MIRAVVLALSLSLTACATAPLPASPQQTVYALEGEYAAALAVGAAYNELPRCPSARNGLCSEAETVIKLRKLVLATNVSMAGVQSAVRGNGDVVNALYAASIAVAELRALTASLKVSP